MYTKYSSNLCYNRCELTQLSDEQQERNEVYRSLFRYEITVDMNRTYLWRSNTLPASREATAPSADDTSKYVLSCSLQEKTKYEVVLKGEFL